MNIPTPEAGTKAPMKIIACTCKHTYQNEKYGPQMRAHNPGKPKAGSTKVPYRCTVCGNSKD